MTNYVLTFRAPKGRVPTAEDEARWPAWLSGVGGRITDPGNRIGQVRDAGSAERTDVLAGYIVITADSLDDAATVAESCPMLMQGGSVEFGEVIPAGPAS